MTTKQIAEAVGKTERTIQGWAKKTGEKIASIGEKIASVQKSGCPADYDLEQTIAIISHGMGKNAADLYRMSAKPSGDDRIGRLENIVATLAASISQILQAPGVKMALPAPSLLPRAELRQLISQGAKNEGGYREAWNRLYSDIYYRMHRNVKECAKNRGMDTLDYIEEEGILPDVVSIAREIFA